GNDAKFTLDIKNGFDFEREVYERTLDLVDHYDYGGRVMLAGWDHEALRWVKETHPRLLTRALLRGRPVNLVEAVRASRADAVSLSYDLTSKREVDALHVAGVAVMISELFEPDFARVVQLEADMLSWGDPIVAIRELQQLGAR